VSEHTGQFDDMLRKEFWDGPYGARSARRLGGNAELAVNGHHLRVGEVVADLADVIRSKESVGRPKDLRVLPLPYRHLSGRRPEREAVHADGTALAPSLRVG
jgi:hypothetical protein